WTIANRSRLPDPSHSRAGAAAKPLAEDALDGLGPQPVTGLLQLLGVGAGAKAVVQRFEGEALLFQLALRPLMPVQAQLQAPGGVAADLQEDGPEVLIVDVKVVVIDVDRLVAIVEGVPFFAGRVGLRLLLGHADE